MLQSYKLNCLHPLSYHPTKSSSLQNSNLKLPKNDQNILPDIQNIPKLNQALPIIRTIVDNGHH